MRHSSWLAMVVVAVLVMSLPQGAEAVYFLDGPFVGDSWYAHMWQQTSETWRGHAVGPYDYVRVDWVSGALLEIPGFQAMNGGWAPGPYGNTSTFSWATGPSNTFYFDWAFQGTPGPAVVDYFVYQGTTLKQAQRCTFTAGGGWGGSIDLTSGPGRFEPIPEPMPLSLLLCAGAGILGLAWRRRRN